MQRLLAAFTLIALTAVSCSPPSSSGKTQEIRLNIHTDPPSLDPRKPSDTTSSTVIRMCFDGLMRRDEEGRQAFGVAKSVSISEDGLTYTFTLRESVWSDGTPVSAKDFEDTWKTILSPNFPSEFANELYILKNGKGAKENTASMDKVGVKALSDYVLQVDLEYPIPYFLDMLMTHSFFPVPSHVASDPKWAQSGGDHYVCNGPYHMQEWKHYNSIVLLKNPVYWDSQVVQLEKIELYMIEDEMTELSMYDNGDLEWIGSPLSSIPVDALSKEKDYHHYEVAGTYFYIFNTEAFPFTNKHIRRAFALSIHRQEIIENIIQGGQGVATGIVPPTMWKERNSYFTDADITLAKKEFEIGLNELGITADQLPPIKLSYNTNSGHHKIAQAIKEQWSMALGIRVDLENMEWKVFLDSVSNHKFQIARMGGIASYNDPISILKDYQYANSRMNQCQWSNKKFATLIDLSDHTQNPEKRMQILSKAEAILMDEMPIAPIYFYTGSYMKKPYVKSVSISDLSEIDFKYTYLEKR
ncbi:MAG: peptide ABC transporter substrate-binding protein [Chlamydiae bacterium]|nr:peptide ABC transporter substrate-binding protein [Chlamydiota bacterium]